MVFKGFNKFSDQIQINDQKCDPLEVGKMRQALNSARCQ